MTDKVVILVTASSPEECRKIAQHLVESQLAACVNISPRIESIYRWEGKIAHDNEYQIFIKTRRDLFPEVKAAIARLHSYQNPEIICLPVIEGSPEYLGWIDESLKRAGALEEDDGARDG